MACTLLAAGNARADEERPHERYLEFGTEDVVPVSVDFSDSRRPYVEASEPQVAAPATPAVPPAPQPVAEGVIPLQTGALTPQQIALMLTHLPVDITFVDENDTETPDTMQFEAGR